MRVTGELQLHRYGGSWASSFTPILQEQMDERAWQKRTLCTAAAATTAAAQHSRIACILQAHEHQVGEEGKTHTQTHMRIQHNNFTDVSFLMKKKKCRTRRTRSRK